MYETCALRKQSTVRLTVGLSPTIILRREIPTGRYVVPTGRVIATDSVIVATSGYVVPAAYDISPGRVK
ncbi:hypothetical protein Tco_1462774 [Tanacetum coccineum]